jgi:hypothetical protein
MINKNNLSRTIPEDVKYKIRKEAGFGCVHCGLAIGVYEHIDPEYADATEHDPARMTYLCENQNQKKRRGYLSKEAVWRWKADPWSKKNSHCHESLDVSSEQFAIWIGGNKVQKIQDIISIGDISILSIKPPEEPGSPYRLSAVFHDEQNNKVLRLQITSGWQIRMFLIWFARRVKSEYDKTATLYLRYCAFRHTKL